MRKSSETQKVSAMVLKVAQGYIDMGESTEEKENYLLSACSAWNIACLPPLKREPAIKQYVEPQLSQKSGCFFNSLVV